VPPANQVQKGNGQIRKCEGEVNSNFEQAKHSPPNPQQVIHVSFPFNRPDPLNFFLLKPRNVLLTPFDGATYFTALLHL